MQYLKLSDARGLPRLASLQNEYSLMCRYFSPDLAEICHQEEVSLLPYSPMAGGLLSGKYSGGAMPEGTRGAIQGNIGGRLSESSSKVADQYVAIARRHGLEPAQMALAFTLTRPQVAATIIGATSMDQLRTDIGARDVTLTDEAMADIAEVYRAHPMPF
jgi:aryl-alcohol dehydrogenase-like predicted oxidoreductase